MLNRCTLIRSQVDRQAKRSLALGLIWSINQSLMIIPRTFPQPHRKTSRHNLLDGARTALFPRISQMCLFKIRDLWSRTFFPIHDKVPLTSLEMLSNEG